MSPTLLQWPYLPTLARLALALGIGLFVGIERERRQKEAGARTFACAALLGAIGGLLGDAFALLILGLLGLLVALLNVDTMRRGEGIHVTTSAALLLTGAAGILAGQGHTFTPAAVGVATAGFLASKHPLAGFSRALTEAEVRSAILLAILACIVYPVLPVGPVDPWGLIDPQAAWITVLLIAGMGFANYILLKLYGARGIQLTGFLGGLVNSKVVVTELAARVPLVGQEVVYRGIVLATAAMLLRNAVILAILAPAALLSAAAPLGVMLAATGLAAYLRGERGDGPADTTASPLATMTSPFSLTATLKFGGIFLLLQIAGALAQRALGHAGFYTVSLVGGLVSSASAVASVANLTATHALAPHAGGVGVVVTSLASTLVSLPLVARLAGERRLTWRLARTLGALAVLGAAAAVAAEFAPTAIFDHLTLH